MWKVRVETIDGEVKVFEALDTYVLTEEQKLLWETAVGERERVTNMRIKTITESKVRDASEQEISRTS